MTAEEFLAALALPAAATVDKRVPKSLLAEHAAVTAADRRAIADGVEAIRWVASLKPTNSGVAAYTDDARVYLEIAVLHVQVRAAAPRDRLTLLIHRAIPYPVILLLSEGADTVWSMVHKRNSLAAGQAMVLDGDPEVADLAVAAGARAERLVAACSLLRQPLADMRALYQGWQDVLTALRASEVTGSFEPSHDVARGDVRREALRTIARVDAELARVRTAATRERQTARLVDLNLQLTHLRAERAAAVERL